ncbi:MAG: ADOP family duplicated permease [Gemmatimonadetes bacterium]|nr:ADOP family duplicated permease [Gemmatimonadota bacterium]
MIRPGVKPLFRLRLGRRSVVDERVDEEVALHLELRARQLEAEGLTPEQARAEALRRFGDVSAGRTLREAARRREERVRLRDWVGGLLQDISYGVRSLWHHRVVSAFVILTLTLGIGANATMFGVVDTLMFQPPPDVTHADQVVRLEFAFPGGAGEGLFYNPHSNYSTYKALAERVPGFQNVAAYYRQNTWIGTGSDARSLDAVLVTASFFRTLGVQPALGRFFSPEEERAEGARTVVLGYGLWMSRFDGDHAVLGRTVDIAGAPCTIIGVAPPHFTGVDLKRVDAWLPIGMASTLVWADALDVRSDDTSSWLSTVARVRPGIGREVIAAQASAAFRAYHAKDPDSKEARVVLAPLPVGRGPEVPAEAKVSLWLGVVSVLVLLVACANVANLLLARAAARSHEVAVRLSLGAGRWRISRQLLVESLMLALCGAGAAVLVMVWSSSFARHVLMPDITAVAGPVSLRILLFAGAVALGTGVLCGLAPALLSARSDLDAILKGRSQGPTGRLRAQRVIVVGQVAFTVVLMAGAGLFMRSLYNVRSKDLGMDVRHVLYADVDFQSMGVSRANALQEYRAMLQRVRGLPGVTAAGLSIGEPFRSGWAVGIRPVTGAASEVAQPEFAPYGRAVSAGFFGATGRRFVAGRPFTTDEHTASAHVAIINEEAARYYWGRKSPLGVCIQAPGNDKECFRIVGVVANTPFFYITNAMPQELYLPLEAALRAAPQVGRGMTMEVRTAGDPEAMVGRVRRAMMAAGSNVPFPSVIPLTDIIDPQYRSWELGAEVFTAFGLLALVLAIVGLYGVLAYAVVQRSRELGIRAALGARPGALVRKVVTGGLATTLLGALIGIAAALAAGRLVASLLYGVSAHDPFSLGCAATVLMMAAGLASYLPARRASRVDPLTVLRSE